VKNNLPGTPEFCPLVFRTPTLERFIDLNLPSITVAVLSWF